MHKSIPGVSTFHANHHWNEEVVKRSLESKIRRVLQDCDCCARVEKDRKGGKERDRIGWDRIPS